MTLLPLLIPPPHLSPLSRLRAVSARGQSVQARLVRMRVLLGTPSRPACEWRRVAMDRPLKSLRANSVNAIVATTKWGGGRHEAVVRVPRRGLLLLLLLVLLVLLEMLLLLLNTGADAPSTVDPRAGLVLAHGAAPRALHRRMDQRVVLRLALCL